MNTIITDALGAFCPTVLDLFEYVNFAKSTIYCERRQLLKSQSAAAEEGWQNTIPKKNRSGTTRYMVRVLRERQREYLERDEPMMGPTLLCSIDSTDRVIHACGPSSAVSIGCIGMEMISDGSMSAALRWLYAKTLSKEHADTEDYHHSHHLLGGALAVPLLHPWSMNGIALLLIHSISAWMKGTPRCLLPRVISKQFLKRAIKLYLPIILSIPSVASSEGLEALCYLGAFHQIAQYLPAHPHAHLANCA